MIPENHRTAKTVKFRGRKSICFKIIILQLALYNIIFIIILEKINEISIKKKVTIEEAQRNIKSSSQKVEDNLQKLLKLGLSSKLDKDTSDKIARRALSRHYIIPEEKKVVEEESVFTEEDFKNFEKELYVD